MNTQITEDFVSFETAKLLKEKGFDESTCGFYHDDYMGKLLVSNPSNHNGSINSIAAPSQAHVMKWLREVHEILIEIPIYSIGKPVLYRWNAFKNGRLVTDEEKPKTSNCIIKGDDNNPTVYYYKYEEACEVAIKYCLENLI